MRRWYVGVTVHHNHMTYSRQTAQVGTDILRKHRDVILVQLQLPVEKDITTVQSHPTYTPLQLHHDLFVISLHHSFRTSITS